MAPASASIHHWVIGDVHGCARALDQLIGLLPGGDRLVLLGDVINRGPEIEEAMDLAWELVRSGRAVWLMGNHESRLVRDLEGTTPQARISLRGSSTYRQLGDGPTRQWQERLAGLPLLHRGDGWVATHAGFDPLTWQPDLTIRLPFWRAYDGRFGEVIVGHTPGPEVRRLGRIVLIDTGACYGGRLTAYCPETRRVVSVPGVDVPRLAGPPAIPLTTPQPAPC
jgi:serine/threonine protein phosphatase 1